MDSTAPRLMCALPRRTPVYRQEGKSAGRQLKPTHMHLKKDRKFPLGPLEPMYEGHQPRLALAAIPGKPYFLLVEDFASQKICSLSKRWSELFRIGYDFHVPAFKREEAKARAREIKQEVAASLRGMARGDLRIVSSQAYARPSKLMLSAPTHAPDARVP